VNDFDHNITMNGAKTAETGVCANIIGIIQTVGFLVGDFREILHPVPNIDMTCAARPGSAAEMGQRNIVLFRRVQNGDSLLYVELLFLIRDECNGRHEFVLVFYDVLHDLSISSRVRPLVSGTIRRTKIRYRKLTLP